MKNFFKKLAFVLALAMIVTAIAPAGKASAAVKPSLKYNKKVLYIGGDATGAYKSTHKFPIKNATGYTVSWKSANKAIATVDAKKGTINAVGVGVTTITATVTSKAGKATELKATVRVKQNAEKFGLSKTETVKEMSVGDAKKINAYRKVGTKAVWSQSDRKTVTDYITWESSNSAVATVSKYGTVTAVAAGEAVITVKLMQSEGPTVVDTKTFPVKVVAGLTAAKQLSKNTIEATFAGDLSAVATKDNVKVYSMVGTTKVNVVVKEVKFDTVDKKKAVITTYTDMVKDTEYVVEYADTNATFKGADLSKEAVKSIKITTTEAVKNEPKAIEIKAYDANGIELPTEGLVIDISAPVNSDYYLDVNAKTIQFFNAAKTATVKAVYHTYKYGADFKEITIDTEAVINSVEKATLTVKSVDAFTVYKDGTTPDFAKASSTISSSDNTTGNLYKVAVKVTTSEGKELKSTDAADKFTFSSNDTTTLLVNGTILYPVKEGGAVVIVKYGDTVVGAYNVTIGAKRIATDVDAKFNKTQLSKANAQDSVKLVVNTKDQFGVDRTGADTVKVTYLTGPVGASVTVPNATGTKSNEFVFKGDDFTVVGTYQFKVEVDKQPRVVYFDVKESGTATGHVLSEAGKTVDLALKVGDTNNTDAMAFDMKLSSVGSNGYKVADIALTTTSKGAITPASGSTGSGIYVTIEAPAGKTATDIAPFVTLSGGAVSVTPVKYDGTKYFTKAPTGVYTVKVLEVTRDANNNLSEKALAIANFTLTDSQTLPAVNIVKTQSNEVTALAALQNKDDVVTIKFGENFYNIHVTDVTTIGGATDKTIAITKAKVDVDVQYAGQKGTYSQEIDVKATITLK